MRFRAEQRLRRQQDFRTAREQGRRIDCGGFTFWYVRRAPKAPADVSSAPGEMNPLTPGPSRVSAQPVVTTSRVGVVASTAAVGCAVQRNRAKRRLREVYRHHQGLVPNDVDLLLVAKHSLNRLPYTEIEQRFVDACRRAFRGPAAVPANPAPLS
jgi:ribonuclease P protein component